MGLSLKLFIILPLVAVKLELVSTAWATTLNSESTYLVNGERYLF